MDSVDPSAGAAGVDNNRGGIGPSNRGNFGLIGNRAPPHSRYYGYGNGYGYGGYYGGHYGGVYGGYPYYSYYG